MDPFTSFLIASGLLLAVAGTIALIAWRHRRSRARVPAILLGLALAAFVLPSIVDVTAQETEPASEDAVVHPDEIRRR